MFSSKNCDPRLIFRCEYDNHFQEDQAKFSLKNDSNFENSQSLKALTQKVSQDIEKNHRMC